MTQSNAVAGPPKEPGVYDCEFADGDIVTVRLKPGESKLCTLSRATLYYGNEPIIAHRPHVPFVVPPAPSLVERLRERVYTDTSDRAALFREAADALDANAKEIERLARERDEAMAKLERLSIPAQNVITWRDNIPELMSSIDALAAAVGGG